LIGTDHACKRYCERIIGMPTKSIPAYLAENKEEIQGYIKIFVKESTFLYHGKIDPKHAPSDYYIHDDIILISRGGYIRTLYRVKFNLPQRSSRKIIKNLVAEIQRQQRLLIEAQEVAARKNNVQERKLAEVDRKILRARQWLKALETKKQLINSRIKRINSKPETIDYDIQLIMQQLCCLPGDRLQKIG